MSAQDNLRNLAINAFRARYEEAVQTGSKLMGLVLTITGVEAETQRFPLIGVVTETTQRTSGQFVNATETPNAKPTATLTPDESWARIDIQDRAITNVEAMQGYADTHGKALMRKCYDHKILAALRETPTSADQTALGPYRHPGLPNAAPYKLRVGTPSAGKDLSGAVIAEAMEMMMEFDDDLDPMDLTLVMPAAQWTKLAADQNLTSADYYQGLTNAGFMKTGKFGPLVGAHPIVLGSKGARDKEGKIEQVGGKNVSYLFHRNAIGLAVGTTEKKGVVKFIDDRRSWLIGGEGNTGATKIQEAGIVEILHA